MVKFHSNFQKFPEWLKISHSLFVAVIVVVYWIELGPENFLWFSDIALLLSVFVLWRESQVVASVAAVSVLLPELLWNLDFFYQLITGSTLVGLANYMFDPAEKDHIRILSGSFHIILPFLLIYFVLCLGYARKALWIQCLVCWTVLPLSYFLSSVEKNINWVHGIGKWKGGSFPDSLFLFLLMILFPLVVYLPTHYILIALDRVLGSKCD